MKKIYLFLLTAIRILKYFFSKTKRYSYILILILLHRPKSILEVGVYNGIRAKQMIEAAKVFNSKISYYGFDLFEQMNTKIFKDELSKLPPTKKYMENFLSKFAKIKLYKGYSNRTLPKFKKKVDFIFIDGGHKIQTIKNDWKYCERLSKRDCIIVFDDYFHENQKLIAKYGCNKVVKNISKKKFAVKKTLFTDTFYSHNKKLKISLFCIKKIK